MKIYPILVLVGLGLGTLTSPALAVSPVRGLLGENRLDEAVVLCRQFEVLATADTDNLYACAWAYYRTDKSQSAEKMMEKLAKQSQGSPEFQLLGAYSKIKKKKFGEAKSLLNALAGEHKSGAIAVLIQLVTGELYEAQGQNDTAAFLYKQIVNDDPTQARAHWGLGRYYLSRGEVARAKSELEEVTRLWPKHLGSRYNLAVMSITQENYPEAARWLAECYKLDRSDSGVLEQMGILFEKKGMIEEAVKYWNRALEYNKDSQISKDKLAQYTSNVVDKYIESKQWKKALAKLDSASNVEKKEASFRLKRGIVYRNLGKYGKAIPDLLSYTRTNKKDPLALRELGICYLNTKLLAQAGTNFARAAEMEPANGLNFAWLAFVMESKGKLAEAREAWKKAAELLNDPVEVEKAQRRLASIEKKLGRKQKQEKEDAPEKDGDEDRDIEKEVENQGIFDGIDGIPK